MEVMVSVMVIVVVIMALFSMSANRKFLFSNALKDAEANAYMTLLVGNEKYGFEKEETTLDALIEGFDVEDELRRKLKSTKVHITYSELQKIDMDAIDMIDGVEKGQKAESESNTPLYFEMGQSSIKILEASSSLKRLRVQ